MANFDLLVIGTGGRNERKPSSAQTIDFTGVRIGASNLTITESSGKFDMGGIIVGNIADGAAAGQALSFSQRGANNGVASLDGGGKVPASQLPSAVMTYEGVWNATTNSPSLADGAGDAGMVYRVGTAGSQNLGSGSISFDVGDYVIYNGTVWEKSDTTDAVASVNGQIGVVVLSTTNIAEGTNLYFTDAKARTAVITQVITNGVADRSPSEDAVFDALALKAASVHTHVAADVTDFTAAAKAATVADAIADGVTDVAPSQNAVFDALALKAASSHTHVAADVTDFTAAARVAAVADAIVDGVTNVAASQNAVFDALALKADASSISVPTLSKTNDNGGSITVRQAVYVKANGNVDLALADGSVALEDFAIGLVAVASIATTAAGNILFAKGDLVSGFSGLTPGRKYYVSRTSGGAIALYSAISWVAGDKVQMVGRALSATVLEFDPSFEFQY